MIVSHSNFIPRFNINDYAVREERATAPIRIEIDMFKGSFTDRWLLESRRNLPFIRNTLLRPSNIQFLLPTSYNGRRWKGVNSIQKSRTRKIKMIFFNLSDIKMEHT